MYLCMKQALIDPYNPWFKEFFQINCPDIFFANIRFPDKNNLFACLTILPYLGQLSKTIFNKNLRQAELGVPHSELQVDLE